MEAPSNWSLSLLEKLELPKHPEVMEILYQIEKIQFDQVQLFN